LDLFFDAATALNCQDLSRAQSQLLGDHRILASQYVAAEATHHESIARRDITAPISLYFCSPVMQLYFHTKYQKSQPHVGLGFAFTDRLFVLILNL
jgi:hypothetical protein